MTRIEEEELDLRRRRNMEVNFKPKLVEASMKIHLQDEKTRINPDALKLMTEVMRLIVTEGAMRAADQAKQEDSDLVELHHMEKIMAQFLLDI
ncbi:centromere protein X-like [Palaemon carinicauda]|uniref:centromere protein X-like n=1 Tax=Palaemon carinicauda TaxID=392227 RepID=UPI0035B5A696